MVVAERGPLLFVAVSAGGEPAAALARRLDLLHGQVTLIVTNAIDRLFAKNPRYDGQNLLGAQLVAHQSPLQHFRLHLNI